MRKRETEPRAKRERLLAHRVENAKQSRRKGNARPILGKRAERGLEKMLGLVPAYVAINDADASAGLRYIADLLAWHRRPETVAKRKARGAQIKNWEQSQGPQSCK